MRTLALTDGVEGLEAYGEYVFGHIPARHHHEMLQAELDAIYRRRNIVILEPRGAAKTTWANTAFLSWAIAKYDLRVGLVSNTDMQAQDFSRAIRWTYESNIEHKEIFGNLASTAKWTNKEWIKAGSRWLGTKDVSCFAVGVGGAIISKRFDILLLDDILDEENTSNVDQREAVVNWFYKTLLPCLAPDGVVVIIGTRWAEEDLYELLMTPPPHGKGWDHRVTQALTEDEQGNLQSYWAERYPVELLLRLREEMGTALFSCAYQNDISGLMAGNVFHGPFSYFDILPFGHSYVTKMGVDLASSIRERADYTARVTSSQDICTDCPNKGNYYVHSVYRDKRESHHAEFVNDGWMAYPNISLVKIERVQFQSTLIQELMSDYPHIPVEGVAADVDKVTRARAVAAKYEAHKVFHHISLKGSAFESELLSFPKGHDDMVDALGYSMDLGGDTFFFGSLRMGGR